MDTSRKICTVLTAADLSPENISETAATIERTPNKVYLLSSESGHGLWNIIEDLSTVIVKKSKLNKMRMAYDLKFDLPTVLKTGDSHSTDGVEVKNFADLLERLDFDENLNLTRKDYHVIINDDGIKKSSDGTDAASRAVAKLFQQTVFLNIVGLDIQKKSELKKAIMKERFRKNYSALVAQIQNQQNFLAAALEYAELNDSGRQRVKDIIDALNKTETELAKAKKRPIRIAAMGTKKAGKSVVINSLLRRDYAPTSSLLPTPNTIKYLPADSNASLTLDYAGKTYTFADAAALKNFIGNEFKTAQKKTGEGSALPDMTVHYPCDELNGYEVWDTPGPNFAGAGDEHRKNAEACIKEVDVCIFVMNYSSYLTDDEEEFLKQIREYFQAEGKFYSLFITVNRIDERYSSEAQKSIIYVLDYICERLEQLNYKNIVAFGTSALQSFYLDKVIELAKTDGATDTPFITGDSIRELEGNHEDEDDLITTQIGFIEGMINNLRRFHGIKDATEKELETFSGVPQLRHYANYIGEAKADMEIVEKVVGDCEGQFAIIKGALDVVEYQTLSEEAKKYLRVVANRIDEVCNMSKEIKYEMEKLISDRKRRDARRTAKDLANQLRLDTLKVFNDTVDFEVGRLSVTEDDIRDLAEDVSKTKFMDSLWPKISGAFTRTKNEAVDDCRKIVRGLSEDRRDEIIGALENVTQKILDKVQDINATLKRAGVPTITLPTFPVSVSMTASNVDISGSINGDLASEIAQASIKVVERTGIIGTILDWFTTKTEVDFDEFKRKIADIVKDDGRKQLNSEFEKLSIQIQEGIDEIFDKFMDDCDDTSKIYQKIFENTHRNIVEVLDETGKKKDELERNISALENISDNLQPYIGIWNEIRGEEINV